jgi:hypothetical protein
MKLSVGVVVVLNSEHLDTYFIKREFEIHVPTDEKTSKSDLVLGISNMFNNSQVINYHCLKIRRSELN